MDQRDPDGDRSAEDRVEGARVLAASTHAQSAGFPVLPQNPILLFTPHGHIQLGLPSLLDPSPFERATL